MRIRHRAPAAAAAVAIAVMIASGSGAAAAAGSTSRSAPAADPCGPMRTVAAADAGCTHGGDPAPTASELRMAAGAPGPVPAAPCPGNGVSGKRIRVFYGYPKDTSNRVSAKRGEIRQAVAFADVNLDEATPGTPGQHLRLYCAKDTKLTVSAVKLKAIGGDGTFTFGDVISSLKKQVSLGLGKVDHKAGRFDYVVFVDNVAFAYPYSGQATLLLDDRADPAANANNGTVRAKYAMVKLGYPTLISAEIFLHEVGHNLGAVQDSAPHSSEWGHCFDESDVMCYDDGGPYFTDGGSLVSVCLAMPSGMPVWDCGADDYYDGGTPAPGSYLDDHWNLVDSGWLSWTA